MTVSSTTARDDYNGNDVTTEFAVTFKFTLNSDIRAVLYNAVTAEEITLVENTDYTLTGAGEETGGTLTMVVAPTSSETLTFVRNIAFSQTYDYIEHSTFPAASHEAALDKLTMLLQQLDEAMTRVLRQSVSRSGSLELPVSISDMFLRWAADGSLVNFDIADLSLYSVTPYAETILECEDSTEVKSVLEIDAVYTTTAQATPDRTVEISTFTAFFGNDRVEYAGISAADLGTGGAFEVSTLTASYYNKILFVINSSGTLIAYEGTPAATVEGAVEPTIPTDEFPICVILVRDDGSAAPGTILNISQSAITQTLRTNSAQFGVTMTDGQLMIGQTGEDFQAKTVSGDVTITKEGVATVTNTSMTDGQVMLGQTGAASEPKTISGDVTITKTGVTTVATDAINTEAIIDSNVTTAKIADSNVTTAKINDLAVTPAKLSKASASTGYWDLIKNENYVPAAGIYILATNSSEHTIFEILISGGWYGLETVSGMYNFDGSTRRITNTSGVATVRVYYHIL